MLRIWLLALAAVIGQAQTGPSSERLKNYLRQNQKEVTIVDGRLGGTGGDWLRTETASARFMFFGEAHSVAEVPRFLTALWPDLARAGYQHVALEAGQWLGNRLDRYVRFNDRGALASFYAAVLPRRPDVTVPPASREDIRFIEALSRAPRARLPVVWGLDHEFKLTPLLKRLQVVVSDRSVRAQVDHLLMKIETAEAAGQYNARAFQADIEKLTARFAMDRNGELSFLADSLRRSLTPDRPMKQIFLREYRAAQQAGEREPRVLLRVGSHHGKRGLMSDFGDSTLGNFVAELAVGENAKFLNIFFISCSDLSLKGMPPRARPCHARETAWLGPFDEVAKANWTLFDLRPLRGEVAHRGLEVSWQLAETIFGWDVILLSRTYTPVEP
jgi:hypothetical protein